MLVKKDRTTMQLCLVLRHGICLNMASVLRNPIGLYFMLHVGDFSPCVKYRCAFSSNVGSFALITANLT